MPLTSPSAAATSILNGGPGAPAFMWAHATHIAWMDREAWQSPLPGWLGHADPFGFTPDYQPAPGHAALSLRHASDPVAGRAGVRCRYRARSRRLWRSRRASSEIDRAHRALRRARRVALRRARFALASPRNVVERGSHVSFAHPTGGYGMVQALIARGISATSDRPTSCASASPRSTRASSTFGTPSIELAQVLETGEWRDARFSVRSVVT